MSLGHITDADEDVKEATPKYLKRLDLACGVNKKENFTGIDRNKEIKPDIIHNLDTYPWPFEDQSCFELHCNHFVEHVHSLNKFMEECHRILVPKGLLVISAPYYTSFEASMNPDHKRVINEKTFLFFNQEYIKKSKVEFDTHANFKVEGVKYHFDPEWATRSEDAKNWAREHYWNVVKNFEITLRRV